MVNKENIPEIVELIKQDTIISEDFAEKVCDDENKVLEVSIDPLEEDTEPKMSLYKYTDEEQNSEEKDQESDGQRVGFVTKFDNPDDTRYTFWNVTGEMDIQDFYEDFAFDPVAAMFYENDDLIEEDVDKIEDIINIEYNKCGVESKIDKMKGRVKEILSDRFENRGFQ